MRYGIHKAALQGAINVKRRFFKINIIELRSIESYLLCMTIGRLGLILVTILLLVSCNDDENKIGTYHYSAFLDNVLVVEGTMEFSNLTVQDASGTWNFHAVGEPRNDVGPQIGTGQFTGSFDGTVANINLNPQFADNNVTLHGTFTGTTLRGEWSFSGFAGVISHGTFMAER